MERIAKLDTVQYRKSKPLLVSDAHLSIFEVDRVETLPEMELFKLEDALLFEDGSVFENNKLISQSLRDPAMTPVYTAWRTLKRRLSYKKRNFVDDRIYFSLLDHWGHEYYHWFFESLPRLEMALAHFQSGKITVVLSERYKKYDYVRESIARYPVDAIYLPLKSYGKFPSLYLSTYAGPSDFHRGDLLRRIHDRVAPATGAPTRKIFISRAKARYRNIVNESAVIALLQEHGYQTVYAEDLNWNEQRDLFMHTSDLIALHGAGLTNILYLPKNANVLEIRKNRYGKNDQGQNEGAKFYNTYFHICDLLGLNYFALPSESPTPDKSCHYADVTVSLDELKILLDRMAGKR